MLRGDLQFYNSTDNLFFDVDLRSSSSSSTSSSSSSLSSSSSSASTVGEERITNDGETRTINITNESRIIN